MEKIQLLIKHAKVFNSYLKKFIDADVSVKDGKFYYIDRKHENLFDAEHTIDADGQYMIPGMVDIHMHIESSMTTPGSFGNCAAKNGVTTVVSEPHEMANVKGVRGILEMISAAKDAPIDIFYGIPSSVPSTSEELETTGGVIDFEAMKHLLGEKDVVCVGEIMNYREIIRENHLEITKFLDYLRQEHPGYVIEGHCPSLVDLDLAKFLYLGINGDHTEHTLEEVKQRVENGMFFEIQDKMLKPEVLSYICENHLFEYCSFVTDDTMAELAGAENVEIINGATKTVGFVMMNMNEEYGGPVSDPTVQKAIRKALDYAGIQTIVGEGTLTPYSIIQTGFMGSKGERATDYTNLDEAKELLAEAGYADGFDVDLTVCDLDMEGVALTDLAQKVKDDLAQIGINVNIVSQPWAAGYGDAYRDGTLGLTVMYWGTDYNDPNVQLEFLPGATVGLRAGWTADMDPELAALYQAAMEATDNDARIAVLEQIQDLTYEDGPFIMIAQAPAHIAHNTRLEGVAISDPYALDLTLINIK